MGAQAQAHVRKRAKMGNRGWAVRRRRDFGGGGVDSPADSPVVVTVEMNNRECAV